MLFECRVLSTMFEPKEEEVTAGWRKFRKGELHFLVRSQNGEKRLLASSSLSVRPSVRM